MAVIWNQYFIVILFLLSFLLILTIFHFRNAFSVNDDGFFSIVPEDYYNPNDYGEESKVPNQLQEENNNTSDQNTLPLTTTTVNKDSFNIAVTADWGVKKILKKQQKIYKTIILNS
jgi:hypothetical protein